MMDSSKAKKAVDKAMVVSDIRLLAKSGGRSGEWHFDGAVKA